MELTDDQCTILILRGQITDLERERDELQKKVDELSRTPAILEVLKASKRGVNIEDIPWLVKDFDVLYRVAEATLHITTMEESRQTRGNLRTQIERLRPGFEQVQAVKRALRN